MKKTTILSTLLPVFFLAACGGAAVSGQNFVPEQPPVVGNIGDTNVSAVKETYAFGETFSVPTCYAVENGKDEKMAHVLYYPDGRTSGYATAKLDALGAYKLVYTHGETVKEVTFNVVSATVDTLFTPIENAKITANVSAQDWCDYDLNGAGVYVVGGTGSEAVGSFRYNGVINLREKTKNDAFIEFIGNSEGDTFAYGTVTVTLTDINDENNYIEIEVRDGAHLAGDECGHVSYVTAQACGKYTRVGYHAGRGAVHEHGTEIQASASGKRYEKRTTTNTVKLSYDAAENALYGNVGPETEDLHKVLDFDDKTMVDERYLWGGFSSDLVYMTVSLKTRFQSDEGTLLLTSVNGTSLAGEKANVSDISFDVDTQGYLKASLPNGAKGAKYPAFSAVAYDNYGRELGEAALKVVDPDGVAVACADGWFATEKTGRYTLVYSYAERTETGVFEKTESLFVTVEERTEALSYSLSSPVAGLTFSIGDKVLLSDGVAQGNVGNVTVKASVTLDGEPVDVIEFGFETYFYADGVGDYVITYSARDLVGNTATVKDGFRLLEPNAPIFEKSAVGTIAVKGEPFQVPLLNAYAYRRGGKFGVPVSVSFDGKDITDSLCFTADKSGEFALKYTAEYGGEREEETVWIKVVERTEETPFIEGYLRLNGFDIGYSELDDCLLEATFQTACAQFSLPVKDTFLSVTVEAEKWEAESLTVTFTDKYNAREKIQIKFAEYLLGGKRSMAAWLNGTLVASIEEIAEDGAVRLRETGICFDPETLSVTDGRGNLFGVAKTTSDGLPFNGFSSGYAYIELVAEGCKVKTETENGEVFTLFKISEHTVSSVASDRTPPSFIVAKNFASLITVKQGESFTVRDLWAYDVFSTDCLIELEIVAPDKKVVYSGVYSRGYSFKAEQIGSYKLRYIATDGNGRRATRDVTVISQAFGLPNITVSAPKTTANVGDAVTLEKPTYDETYVSVYLYIVRPDGARVTVLPDKKSGEYRYAYLDRGMHTVRYVAIDGASNVNVVEFSVEVK